jgi:hypothetical protein
MLCEVLPGVKADPVEELVGNAHAGLLNGRSRRLLLQHRPLSIAGLTPADTSPPG